MDCPTGKLCDGINAYDETICDNPPSGYFCDGNALKTCTSKYSMYCTSSSYCTQCEAYRVLDTTTYTCNIPCTHYIPNCIYCYDATKCQNCIGGYYVDSSNKCSSCTNISNCINCSSASTCTQCKQGYYLDSSNKCLACNVLNCATCAKDGTCESCNQGYHL